MFDRDGATTKLLLIVAAANTAGVACFYATAHAHLPVEAHHVAASTVVADLPSMLDSLGFTLMLPGIFFAAIAFLLTRALTRSEAEARAVWYATGFVINLMIAWKLAHALEAARS